MKRKFHKILIANRGEIAVRIIRTAQQMGIRTVAVYASDDAQSLHVLQADEAFLLDGSLLAETYLNQQKLVDLALQAWRYRLESMLFIPVMDFCRRMLLLQSW